MNKSFQGRAVAIPTCDTAAYAANDLIGGKLTLEGLTQPILGAVIQTINVIDLANQKSALDLFFFTKDPSATTFTDQAALDVDDADLPYAFLVQVAASDYVSLADNAIATIKPSVAFTPQNADGKLFLAIRSGGTPDYVAASDLVIVIETLG